MQEGAIADFFDTLPSRQSERVKSNRNPLEITVSSDILMLIGLIWCALGFYFKEMWWELGGFMLFYMGVMTLGTLKSGEEDRHEERGES